MPNLLSMLLCCYSSALTIYLAYLSYITSTVFLLCGSWPPFFGCLRVRGGGGGAARGGGGSKTRQAKRRRWLFSTACSRRQAHARAEGQPAWEDAGQPDLYSAVPCLWPACSAACDIAGTTLRLLPACLSACLPSHLPSAFACCTILCLPSVFSVKHVCTLSRGCGVVCCRGERVLTGLKWRQTGVSGSCRRQAYAARSLLAAIPAARRMRSWRRAHYCRRNGRNFADEQTCGGVVANDESGGGGAWAGLRASFEERQDGMVYCTRR